MSNNSMDSQILNNIGPTTFGSDSFYKKQIQVDMGQTNINDEKMRNLFEEGISKIRNAENKDGVIVIGNTGAGKSTLINYLLGCKMVYKKKKGNKTYETAENEFAKIGHKALTSQTLYPEAFENQKEKIIYCDCPGFGENRGLEERICETALREVAIKSFRSIRSIIVVISFAEITAQRGQAFSEICNILGQLLQKRGNLDSNIIFAITKTKQSLIDIRQFLTEAQQEQEEKKQQQEHQQDKQQTKRIQNSIYILKLMLSAQIVVVDLLKDLTYQEVVTAIVQSKPITINEFNFSEYCEDKVQLKSWISHFANQGLDHMINKLKNKNTIEFCYKYTISLMDNIVLHLQGYFDQRRADFDNQLELQNSKIQEIDTDELIHYQILEFSAQQEYGPVLGHFISFGYWRYYGYNEFEYNDLPYQGVVLKCQNGDFSQTFQDMLGGRFKSTFTYQKSRNTRAEVIIKLQKRHIPGNATQLSILSEQKQELNKKRQKTEIDFIRYQSIVNGRTSRDYPSVMDSDQGLVNSLYLFVEYQMFLDQAEREDKIIELLKLDLDEDLQLDVFKGRFRELINQKSDAQSKLELNTTEINKNLKYYSVIRTLIPRIFEDSELFKPFCNQFDQL